MIFSRRSSDCSCIAIDEHLAKPQVAAANDKTAQSSFSDEPRRVWFDDDKSEHHEDTIRNSQDCEDTWYTAKDFHRFQEENDEFVRSILEEGSNQYNDFRSIVEELYRTARHAENGLNSDMLTFELEVHLRKMYALECTYELIGLEKEIVFSVKRAIRQRTRSLNHEVHDIQMDLEFGAELSDISQELSETSHSLSQPPTVFSILLAVALQQSEEPLDY
mmetsp:Transcript_11175/g.24935  ORF Transcript_11175/g.24935 Transcript_11175/m.24935 type:complete len:219 (-) Transcript_11175:90-746(-)